MTYLRGMRRSSPTLSAEHASGGAYAVGHIDVDFAVDGEKDEDVYYSICSFLRHILVKLRSLRKVGVFLLACIST